MKEDNIRGKPYTEKEAGYLVELLMQAPGVIAVFRGKDHICEYVNENLFKLIGGRDIIGMDIYHAFPGAESTISFVEEVYRTGHPKEDREYSLKIDWEQTGIAREYFFNYIFQPLLSDDGTVSGVMAFGFDVTATVLARRYYERLLSSMAEAVVITDEQFVITHWNRAAEGLLGRAEEVIGLSFVDAVSTEYYSPEFPEVTGPEMHSIFSDKDEWRGEARVLGGPGMWRDVIMSQCAIKERDGTIIGFVVVYYDITEFKTLERRKDDFISFASHEFKTPLTTLAIYADVLEYEVQHEPSQVARTVRRIKSQTEDLSRLVGTLLDFSKTEERGLALQKKEFSLDTVIRDIVGALHVTAARHEILVRGRSERHIFGDPERIGQVIMNLLGNAIKFSPDGGEIVVSLRPERTHVRVSVADHGIGISDADQKRVFERFYRAEGPQEKTFPGFGIGLSFAKHIVEGHGGEIGVESIKGAGSTFFFTLPYGTRE